MHTAVVWIINFFVRHGQHNDRSRIGLPFSDLGGMGSILTEVVVAWRDVDTSATWQGTEANGSLFTVRLAALLLLVPSWPFQDEATGSVLLHPTSECTTFVLPAISFPERVVSAHDSRRIWKSLDLLEKYRIARQRITFVSTYNPKRKSLLRYLLLIFFSTVAKTKTFDGKLTFFF